jgi:5'-3' exonuclease
MARLGDVLTAEGTRLQTANKIEVVVSTTKEAGEGEHKLMTHMRLVKPVSCTIYGLDADLILLAMLLGVDTGASVRLMREAQEFEQKGSGQGWRNLDVRALAAAIIPQVTDDKVRDFVASMTLLGNDFLPRSLTHTVRDDGIPDLVTALGSWVWSTGRRVIGSDGSVSRDGLLALVRSWSQTEERDLVVAAISAQKASRYPPGIGATPEETALKEWNSQPARWASVCQILNPRERQALHPDWLTVYKGWHPGSAVNYLNGVAWTWDYYSGRAVDQGWFFDEHLPPLWSDVATTLSSSTSASVTPPPIMYPTPLPDWLHLLAVLPADSVVQLLPHSVQKLMGAYPWYWPTSWTVFDVGKTQLWECEPVIPVIPEVVLRSMKEKGS